MLLRIPAFLDGNSYVHYHELSGRFIAGNSEGLIKIFDPELPDSEPLSVDIPENLTSLSSLGRDVLLTSTDGSLAVLSLSESPNGDEKFEVIHKTDRPLRDSAYINEGKRIATGGDSGNLILIDTDGDSAVTTVSLGEPIVNISYNPAGELISVCLANGDVQLVSVMNENPDVREKLPQAVPGKQPTSTDIIDFDGAHRHELVATKTHWLGNGELFFVPTTNNTVKGYNRANLQEHRELNPRQSTLISFTTSPNLKFILTLHENGTLVLFDAVIGELVKTFELGQLDHLPLSVAWNAKVAFVGTTNGELRSIPIVSKDPEEEPSRVRSEVDSLFLDEADESDTDLPQELLNGHAAEKRRANGLDDSRIIDEDEEDDDFESEVPFNRSVDDYLRDRHKRQRLQNGKSHTPPPPLVSASRVLLKPYTPGSTPWITSSNTSTQRRYLFMNQIAYVWAVKSGTESSSNQQSITISFFDRTNNKDYHFIDNFDYDLCSVNERGVLLGNSGFESGGSENGGHIYYRHHTSTNDAWDRQIPLLKGEYITSLCLTSSTLTTSSDSLIVVGTNFGYLRFFNLYGLCINLMKVAPIVTLISSLSSIVFTINQPTQDSYDYSIIDVSDDYKFLQQGAPITLKSHGDAPLIKGLFFNEFGDPCVVSGLDDTLTVLSQWRETANARWVPILSCSEVVSDYGITKSKRLWKTWPLGLQRDKFICLILKNANTYPGFPLSLPLELDVKLPTKSFKHLRDSKEKTKKRKPGADDDEEEDDESDHASKLEKLNEEDPEEEFLRASTLGKLLHMTLPDLEDQDELLERLNGYSVAFDKSLLKLFANACQDQKLNKALSVVKLVKNDKALLAASRIAERFEFMNLAAKINKLREDLHEFEEEEE